MQTIYYPYHPSSYYNEKQQRWCIHSSYCSDLIVSNDEKRKQYTGIIEEGNNTPTESYIDKIRDVQMWKCFCYVSVKISDAYAEKIEVYSKPEFRSIYEKLFESGMGDPRITLKNEVHFYDGCYRNGVIFDDYVPKCTKVDKHWELNGIPCYKFLQNSFKRGVAHKNRPYGEVRNYQTRTGEIDSFLRLIYADRCHEDYKQKEILFNSKYVQDQFSFFYKSGYWSPEIVFFLDDMDYKIPGTEHDIEYESDSKSDTSHVSNTKEESSCSSQSDNEDDGHDDSFSQLEKDHYKKFTGDATSNPVSELEPSLLRCNTETSVKLKKSVTKNINRYDDDDDYDLYGSKIHDILQSSDDDSDCNVNSTSATKIDCNKTVFLKRTRTNLVKFSNISQEYYIQKCNSSLYKSHYNQPRHRSMISDDAINKIVGRVYDKLVESCRVQTTSYYEIADYLCVICGNQFFDQLFVRENMVLHCPFGNSCKEWMSKVDQDDIKKCGHPGQFYKKDSFMDHLKTKPCIYHYVTFLYLVELHGNNVGIKTMSTLRNISTKQNKFQMNTRRNKINTERKAITNQQRGNFPGVSPERDNYPGVSPDRVNRDRLQSNSVSSRNGDQNKNKSRNQGVSYSYNTRHKRNRS